MASNNKFWCYHLYTQAKTYFIYLSMIFSVLSLSRAVICDYLNLRKPIWFLSLILIPLLTHDHHLFPQNKGLATHQKVIPNKYPTISYVWPRYSSTISDLWVSHCFKWNTLTETLHPVNTCRLCSLAMKTTSSSAGSKQKATAFWVPEGNAEIWANLFVLNAH